MEKEIISEDLIFSEQTNPRWTHEFIKSNDTNSIGVLKFERTSLQYDNNGNKFILPKIEFTILEANFSDSAISREAERAPLLSSCVPVVGATIITTTNFCFWSKPHDITCAFECNGQDFTRPEIKSILNEVNKQKKKITIEEFIAELAINVPNKASIK
ncbi:MAG: hypothetical protein MK078_17285 [Crocinitomicaceae bacterium]|nr:hypothetical protein [Crocinitomicaceae bacterium]